MASAERMSDKVARITKNPKFIRNICTSAHIHHGKCIAGDSRIIGPKEIKTAQKIFEEVSQDGIVIEENDEHIVYAPKTEIFTYSLNKETGKLEQKPIQYAWRLVGGETIKVHLRNGFEIQTTPEHKYIAYNEGFKEIEAKDIKLGDRIVCARKLDSKTNITKEDILNLLSQENFYVNLNSDFSISLNKEILNINEDIINIIIIIVFLPLDEYN